MIDNQGQNTLIIPESVRQVLPPDLSIYLVGGAVRDSLVNRRVKDLDFVLPTQALKTARRVANALKADFFVLDGEREIGRVIIEKPQDERQVLDFALQRSSNLEGDLLGRDFTINAIAIDLNNPGQLIDPLGGSRDLFEKKLRACSDSSIKDDPVRILRGVRMASLLKLRIQTDTLQQMRQGVKLLSLVSAERIRDEIYHILETPGCASSIRTLDRLGVIKNLFPEFELLKNTATIYDSRKNQWDHSLEVLQRLEALLNILSFQPTQDAGNNLMAGLMSLKLGRFRTQINDHLNKNLTPGRMAKQTLFLAALFAQLGNPIENDAKGLGVKSRLQTLCLGNSEIERIMKIITHFSFTQLHIEHGKILNRREIYRFFRSAGESGIDAGLLFLAEKLVSGGLDLTADVFAHQLSIVRALFEAWWDQYDTIISPALFINGDDLMTIFNLEACPLVGKVLAEIKEGQAAGDINSREEALALASRLINQKF